ncbi:MAG: helix-turn-helix domain-containing protein [Acidimicrobiia bacterium]|nr:helix-turn-helix domain-containing protein [Acidimicrobiia bacterium]
MERRAPISLTVAAERLGVHYMTAYRYVRTGRLPATRDGVQWRVDPVDIDRWLSETPPPASRGSRAGARHRLEHRMVAGDVVGAWSIIERTLASGATPAEIYLELLIPSLRSIGGRWATGALSIVDEHRASVTAQRLIGRLGPRFLHHGRTRGTVVIGAPSGDLHALPSAIMSDLLRDLRFTVVDLGAGAPPGTFVDATRDVSRLLAVCVGVSGGGCDDAIAATVAAVKEAGVAAPVLVGGGGVADADHARRLGADGWTGADARTALAAIEATAPRPRPPRPRPPRPRT